MSSVAHLPSLPPSPVPNGRERPRKLLWKSHANKPSTLTCNLERTNERVFDLREPGNAASALRGSPPHASRPRRGYARPRRSCGRRSPVRCRSPGASAERGTARPSPRGCGRCPRRAPPGGGVVLRVRDVAGEADPVAALGALRAIAASPLKQWIATRSAEPSSRTRRTSGHASRTWTTIGFRTRSTARCAPSASGPGLLCAIASGRSPGRTPRRPRPGVVEELLDPRACRLVEVPASWGCIPAVAKTPEIESASSRDVADVAGSTPTHSRRSTPAPPARPRPRVKVPGPPGTGGSGCPPPALHREFRVRSGHRRAMIGGLKFRCIRGDSRETSVRSPSIGRSEPRRAVALGVSTLGKKSVRPSSCACGAIRPHVPRGRGAGIEGFLGAQLLPQRRRSA